MKTQNPTEEKSLERPTEAPKREQLLAYAESRPRIEERAIRATVSIHQLHLNEFTHDR